MDKITKLIQKNLIALLIIIVVICGAGFFIYNQIYPKVTQTIEIMSDIKTNQERYEGLLAQQKEKEEKAKTEKNELQKAPVKIYKSANKNLPVESTSIDFVSTVINMLERTNNTIMDISYDVDKLPESDKQSIPSNVSVVQLVLTVNATYTSFQDFVYDLYNSDNLATIREIKVTPLKENKNYLEISTVIWLYVAK